LKFAVKRNWALQTLPRNTIAVALACLLLAPV